MTTYTVTAKSSDDIQTFSNKTLTEAKAIKKALWGYTVTWKKFSAVETPKAWYYRGAEVEIVEERQNGWTLVNNRDGSRYFYLAVTREMEQR